jgi:predicted Zn-dependent peptidase
MVLILGSSVWAFDLGQHVEEFTLSNGMKWLIVKREGAPVFSGVVMVRVGGADEQKGKTGLAHMFEHMAFKGSSKLGTKDWEKEQPLLDEIEALGEKLTALEAKPSRHEKEIARLRKNLEERSAQASRYQLRNEVWEILMRNGANNVNAYTSKDLTTYHASMPTSKLGLWAAVTAEMIFEPAFREFYTERSVVSEERRTSVENSPEGVLAEKILATAYDAGPYSWSTIGFEKDVEGLTIGDARRFHKRFYVPSNMVGVIVGDINPSKVKRILKEVFGRYPSTSSPKEAITTGSEKGNRKVNIRFNAEPALAIAYHKPTLPNRQEYVFDVMTSLLCDGRSSWLEKRLIYEDRLAKDVYCSDGYPGSRFDNLLLIWIEPLKGRSMERIVAAVDEEIGRLKAGDIEEADLNRVHKQVTASIMFALDSNEKLAEALARFQTVFGNWKLLENYPANIDSVSLHDVKDTANAYLVKSNRVIVERSR